DALCILTEWDQFKELDVAKLKKMLAKKVIFDGRNLLDQKQVEAAGLIYFAIGKRTNGYNEETISSALLKNSK
ncbi:MAG TPA: UDP binding domain-containing protein, partial [Candidatus Saccharimonadales bacterium]|nr:UDP binding domain-containing protein [Candidatus Saccharimonadales bacterium]